MSKGSIINYFLSSFIRMNGWIFITLDYQIIPLPFSLKLFPMIRYLIHNRSKKYKKCLHGLLYEKVKVNTFYSKSPAFKYRILHKYKFYSNKYIMIEWMDIYYFRLSNHTLAIFIKIISND